MDERVRERFLKSLKYPGFNQRRNQIDAAYGDTLEWIFVGDNDEGSNDGSGSDGYHDSNSNASGDVDEEGQSDQGYLSDEERSSDHDDATDEGHGSQDGSKTRASGSAGDTFRSTVSDSETNDTEEEYSYHEPFREIKWASFSNWLSSTDPIYWISGKPGSGKTTVVKYVLADERTKKYLDIWCPGCAIVSHYFWLPGSPLQRNMEGLFFSLLYQLLEKNPVAFMEVMPSVSGSKSSYTDWSSSELHLAFSRALESYTDGVCLFVDGIDEIKPEDGTKDGIPEFLDWAIELSRISKIKLCLASRPDPQMLETCLTRYPRMRLQDLNFRDLVKYAKGRVNIPEKDISDYTKSLLRSLAYKAEGVFLWLILAVKSVNEGFRNDDSVKTLQERIDCLPQGLDSLYKDMWARAGADNPSEYRQTAAHYFKLFLASKRHYMGMSAFDVVLATTCLADEVLHAVADPSKLVREDEMLQQCREVEKKLNIYCVGLIETVSEDRGRFEGSAADCSWYGHVYDNTFPFASGTRLEFVHRTARDFLTDTESGREILGFDTSSNFSIECRLLYAWLANVALFAQRDSYASDWGLRFGELFRRWRHIGRELPQKWNQLFSVCEQLADSGRLFADKSDLTYLCSGARFLNHMAPWCAAGDDNELLISRMKNRFLSEGEKSSFLLASITRGSFTNSQSLFRTCREMLRAGADPNWKGWVEWGDVSGFKMYQTRAFGLLQSPWQKLLSCSMQILLRPEQSPTDHAFLAELIDLFVSEGAKLSDPVNFAFKRFTTTICPHVAEGKYNWCLEFLSWTDAYQYAILTSIPAYMIVKLLTNTLRNSCSTLDRGSFSKVCTDLETACESYRSGGTCRVFGKSEGEWDIVLGKNCFAWWEATNDAQMRLGSKLMEWLEGQLLRSTQASEGSDSSESRIDSEQSPQCIWDDESWSLRNSEIGLGSTCERLVELGVMISLDGVVGFHSQEEWVRKHNLENPQYGGAT